MTEKRDLLLEEYNKLIENNMDIIDRLGKIVEECDEILEGNIFYKHGKKYEDRVKDEDGLYKQLNLYKISKDANSVLEIGFNAGHSALIYLLANNYSKVLLFDLCEHEYTKKCFDYLNSIFPNRMELISGDSTKTIPNYFKNNDLTLDIAHIDGGHTMDIARADFNNVYNHVNKIIVFDDDYLPEIEFLINNYIKFKLVKEKKLYKTIGFSHIVLEKCSLPLSEINEKIELINNMKFTSDKMDQIVDIKVGDQIIKLYKKDLLPLDD